MSKNVINQIKTLLGMEVKLEQMRLDNGTVIEADAFEQGYEIFIVSEEDRVPLPMGDYTLEDGRMLVIAEDGIIGEIKEAQAEEEAPVEAPAEVEASEEISKPKKVVESVSKETFFSEIEALKNEINELKLALQPKEVEEVEVKAEEVKTELSEEVKPLKHSPEKNAKEKVNLYSNKVTLVEFLNNKKKK